MLKSEFLSLLDEARERFGDAIPLHKFYDFAKKKGYTTNEIRYWLSFFDNFRFKVRNFTIFFEDSKPLSPQEEAREGGESGYGQQEESGESGEQ